MLSISVSITDADWDLPALLAGPLASRTTFAVSPAGTMRRAGFPLLPTYSRPHYDLLLAAGAYAEAVRLLSLFGCAELYPYKRGPRW